MNKQFKYFISRGLRTMASKTSNSDAILNGIELNGLHQSQHEVIANDNAKTSNKTQKRYKVMASQSLARYGILELAHGNVETPVFMPGEIIKGYAPVCRRPNLSPFVITHQVGTQGAMKGITAEQLLEMDCQILLCNTYHLGHRPGHDLIEQADGLHNFMRWPRPILTDSGGFQMVSLSQLMQVSEEGVQFQSPHTEQVTLLTPEHCIQIQESLGSDIMMQLDHVIPSLTEGPIVVEAMHRSIRWLDRCSRAQTKPERCFLFPIVQGGLDLQLREQCVREMIPRAKVGIAIGGLSGGEAKDSFWQVVAKCCQIIPQHLPRYVMGVGWAIDLVVCSALGADMFDCVYPTRTARFGTALTRHEGSLRLTQAPFKEDLRPIDSNCLCFTCQSGYSRAFIHTAIKEEAVPCHLITIHNLYHHFDLMRRLRAAIRDQKMNEFLSEFLREQYKQMENVPKWVQEALDYGNYKWHF